MNLMPRTEDGGVFKRFIVHDVLFSASQTDLEANLWLLKRPARTQLPVFYINADIIKGKNGR